MLPWVEPESACFPGSCVNNGAGQKLSKSKSLEPNLGSPELGAIFPGVGAGAGTIGTLNSGPEPEPGTECFPGAEA